MPRADKTSLVLSDFILRDSALHNGETVNDGHDIVNENKPLREFFEISSVFHIAMQ